MASQQLEHMVQKPDPGRDLGSPLPVQVDSETDVGLASRANDFGDSWQIAQDHVPQGQAKPMGAD
jgi:hypothetical protein